VVKPEYALPLDPSFLLGRITAEELVAMGYRDAWRYLKSRDPAGVALDETATRMAEDLRGFRFGLRLHGTLAPTGGTAQPVTLVMVAEVRDLGLLTRQPGSPVDVIGGIEHPRWGYRPFVDASVVLDSQDGERRVSVVATVNLDGQERRLEARTSLGKAGHGRLLARFNDARRWTVTVHDAPPESATAVLTVRRRDALQALLRFEPTGAHTATGRLSILATTTRLVRRVMITTGDLTPPKQTPPKHQRASSSRIRG